MANARPSLRIADVGPLLAAASLALTPLWVPAPVVAQERSPASTAPRLKITIDSSNAEATLKLLDSQNVTAEDLRSFGALPSTQALLRKAKSWNLTLSAQDLWEMMKKAKAGEKGNVFNYNQVVAERAQIATLINRLSAERGQIEQYLSAELAPFLPTDKPLSIDVIVILGGFSSGFTLGGASTMYAGAHLYKGDFLGFRNMLLHEAFHNVQAVALPRRDLEKCLSENERRAVRILDIVFNEGSAEYVSDLWKLGEASPFSAVARANMQINANSWRFQHVEKLIDFMVVNAVEREADDPDPEFLNTILSDWNWNNPGYYWGYKSVGELTAAQGRDKLASYLRRGSAAFFSDFLALRQASAKPTQFSPRFGEIVRSLDAKVAACPLKA